MNLSLSLSHFPFVLALPPCYFPTTILESRYSRDGSLKIGFAFSTYHFCCEFSPLIFSFYLNSRFYFHLLSTFTVILIGSFHFFLCLDRCSPRSSFQIRLLLLERYRSSLMCLFDPHRICVPSRRSLLSHGLGI
jgi:hypothetical protein